MPSSIERIFNVAESDQRIQTVIDAYFLRIGHPQHLVAGLSFVETNQDSPAFCLGFQTFNLPFGFIFVSEGLLRSLTQEELEFVVLHEMGHIMKNHFVGSSFVWLTKSWIIDMIADMFEISRQKAVQYLDFAKALYMFFSKRKTPEEEAKATYELEADNFAVSLQGRKEPAITTLQKLSHGDIGAPTHVTLDGSFPFPIITCKERIDALDRWHFFG